MYEYIPQGSNKNAKNLISLLILGGFVIMLVTMMSEGVPFKWALQLTGLILMAIGILLMARYVSRSFIYRVEQTDGGADLSVIEIQRKSRIVVCRISLSNIKDVHILGAADKEQEKTLVDTFKADGRKKYNYCIDVNPEKYVWIVADECGEDIAVKLTYDEKLCEIIMPAKSE